LVISHISERAQTTTNHRETSRKEFCKGWSSLTSLPLSCFFFEFVKRENFFYGNHHEFTCLIPFTKNNLLTISKVKMNVNKQRIQRWATRTPSKIRNKHNTGAPNGWAVPAPHVAPTVVLLEIVSILFFVKGMRQVNSWWLP
jgi:hypothetical protein